MQNNFRCTRGTVQSVRWSSNRNIRAQSLAGSARWVFERLISKCFSHSGVSIVTCKWTGKVCKTLEVTSNEPASSPGKVLLQHSKWPGPKAANMHRGLEKVKESFFVPLDLQEILSLPGRQAACDWYYTLQAVFEDWQETASRKRNDQQIYQTIPRTNDQWRNFSEIKFMQNDVSWTIETFESYTSFNLSFFHWSVFHIPW